MVLSSISSLFSMITICVISLNVTRFIVLYPNKKKRPKPFFLLFFCTYLIRRSQFQYTEPVVRAMP